jgi:hypothetical protein
MNPKPFASLNHFTVPVAMRLLFLLKQGDEIRRPTLSAEH